MGSSCTCGCGNQGIVSDQPIVIHFVAFWQTGKNQDLIDSCGLGDPNKWYLCQENWCCSTRFIRSQMVVDFTAWQLPVWVPFINVDCSEIKNKEKVKYDFSKCEYPAPYIKDLKITINSKIDVYDDFQYIFRTSQPLKVVSGNYKRGGSSFNAKAIDPNTGNTFLSTAGFDKSKSYFGKEDIGYIECSPGIKTLKGEITLSNGGKAYVAVGAGEKGPSTCKWYDDVPSGLGYNEGGQYTVKAPFEADIEKLLNGAKSGHFIYPILIDYEYNGFTVPDDKMTVTFTLTSDTTVTNTFPQDCQNMNSCQSKSIIETLYQDFKIDTTYTYTSTIISGRESCRDNCEFGTRIKYPAKTKQLPAPQPKVAALVFEINSRVYGNCISTRLGGNLRKVTVPIVPLQSTVVFGSNNQEDLGYFEGYGNYTPWYKGGTKKKISTNINVKDLCDNIKNDIVNLPCSNDRDAYINPSYEGVKSIGCSSFYIVFYGIGANTKSPTVPDNSIGVYYNVSMYGKNICGFISMDGFFTELCNGDVKPKGVWDACEDYQSSRKWFKDCEYNGYVGVSISPNYTIQYDRDTECIYDSYYVDTGGKRIDLPVDNFGMPIVCVDSCSARYKTRMNVEGNAS